MSPTGTQCSFKFYFVARYQKVFVSVEVALFCNQKMKSKLFLWGSENFQMELELTEIPGKMFSRFSDMKFLFLDIKPPPVATSYLTAITVLHIQCAASNCDVCCFKCQSDWKQNRLLNPLPNLVLYFTVFQVRIIKSSECNPFPAKIFLVQSQQWNTRRKCAKHQNDVIEHLSHLFLIYLYLFRTVYPTNIYLFKVNNENTTKRCEISSNLTSVYF